MLDMEQLEDKDRQIASKISPSRPVPRTPSVRTVDPELGGIHDQPFGCIAGKKGTARNDGETLDLCLLEWLAGFLLALLALIHTIVLALS